MLEMGTGGQRKVNPIKADTRFVLGGATIRAKQHVELCKWERERLCSQKNFFQTSVTWIKGNFRTHFEKKWPKKTLKLCLQP